MNPISMDASKVPVSGVQGNDPAEGSKKPSPGEAKVPPVSEEHTILVVDDEAVILEVVEKELIQSGYKVVTARDGQEALDKIGQASEWGSNRVPDLIIADIMMPGMDGFEFCQRVKADPKLKSIPFLFLTVKNTPSDRARALILGCQRYVLKPFTRKDLLQAVNERLVDFWQTQSLLAEHDRAFEGDLTEYTVLSLVDLFLIGGWSGTLTILAQGKEGRVDFASGEVAKVQWGEKEGEQALVEILAQEDGIFVVERAHIPPS